MTQLHDLRVTAASAGTQGGSVENLEERLLLLEAQRKGTSFGEKTHGGEGSR